MEVQGAGCAPRPYLPVVEVLPTIAKVWVDFDRYIHAVTLFERGFGEVIRPATSSPTCLAAASDKYYLAGSVSDLRDIMRRPVFLNHVATAERIMGKQGSVMSSKCSFP